MKQKAAGSAPMMRIAIAGGGGLGFILAQQITQGAHPVLVLSRRPHPEFEQDFQGCQVAVVDFQNVEDLRYTLQGVDLLISTISNNEQLNLIDAARRARVRMFVPSEFEGDLSHRPPCENDPLDHGSHAARDLLESWSQSRSHYMRYTIFSCGIFMERFGPNGLQNYGIGAGTGIQSPDDYLVNVGEATAEVVENNAQGRPAQIVLTSVYDLARFMAAAIEIGPANWPREIKIRGESMTVRAVVATCSDVRGIPFTLAVHSYQEAQSHLEFSREIQDWIRWGYFQRLLQTANGRYHLRHPNVNDILVQHGGAELRPMRFREWLQETWGPAL